jgi:hypothetical protein
MPNDPKSPRFILVTPEGTVEGPSQAHVERYEAALADAKSRRARWPKDPAAAMAMLARSFPSLAIKDPPGLEPWDSMVFFEWLCGPGAGSSHGQLLAAQFVLMVWNSHTDWEADARENGFAYPSAAKRFNLGEAVATWDAEHRDAAAAWLMAPFFP